MGIATFRISHLFGSFEKAFNNFNVLRSDKGAEVQTASRHFLSAPFSQIFPNFSPLWWISLDDRWTWDLP
jgi:hypothetical protein